MDASYSNNNLGVLTQSDNQTKSNKRERHSPKRYGRFGQLNLDDSLEDLLNLGDDSFEDRLFVPTGAVSDSSSDSTKVVKRSAAKKLKVNSTSTTSNAKKNNHKQIDSLDVLKEITSINLDNEFDNILLDANQNKVISNSPNANKSSNHGILCDVELCGEKKDKLSGLSFENHKKSSDDPILSICQSILSEFRNYAKESLARISILEEAMIKNGILTLQKPKAAENFENSRIFSKSNRLPISNDADFHEFEKNLEDEDFKNVTVIF